MMSAVEKMSPDRSVGSASSDTDQLLREAVRLNSILMGFVLGVLTGLVIFVATLWLVIKGGPRMGEHLSLLSQFFPGYSVSFLGSFVGLGYGFVSGFLTGSILGRLYNTIVRISER